MENNLRNNAAAAGHCICFKRLLNRFALEIEMVSKTWFLTYMYCTMIAKRISNGGVFFKLNLQIISKSH